MPGFTAINASAVSEETKVTDNTQDGENASTSKGKRRKPARKKAADESSLLDNQAAQSATPARISGQGKKRAGQSTDESSTKRRKKSGLPTTKSGFRSSARAKQSEIARTPKEDLTSDSTYTGEAFSSSKARLESRKYGVRQRSAGQANDLEPGHCVSVNSPQTSMSSIQSLQSQTTMQAVQNSTGGGSLLYSNDRALPIADTTVGFARPLLVSISLPVQEKTGMTALAGPNSQLPTPVNSDPSTRPTGCTIPATSSRVPRTDSGDYGELSDGADNELIELTKRIETSDKSGERLPSRERRLNIRDVDEHEDYGGALLTEEDRKLLASLKPPKDQRKPIVRTKFPSPILDRTSLFGVSNTTVLRTCFRVGEALNTGCQAVRTNWNVVLELYARVTSSWREPKPSRKQHFIINDLYHDRPPFINGTFELWDQNALWEQDSRPFLDAKGDGMTCRMLAKMKRDGAKWRLEILSIWRADWEDIDHVAGVYTKETSQNNG